jgi:hypothetical protein
METVIIVRIIAATLAVVLMTIMLVRRRGHA